MSAGLASTLARRPWLMLAGVVIAVVIGVGLYLAGIVGTRDQRLSRLRQYRADPQAHADWAVVGGSRCGEAPFLIPTDGYIGFLWGDSFRPGHTHQGLDIFAPASRTTIGETPVVAAYDGYLTRRPEWRSAVIIRHPQDPLQPGRQIWTYYTHMADPSGTSFIEPDFPAGTSDLFVAAGTLLGYQGNFSGTVDNPTGVHLHFSIVRDDGQGNFLNELRIENTLDPSPYIGIETNAAQAGNEAPVCTVVDRAG